MLRNSHCLGQGVQAFHLGGGLVADHADLLRHLEEGAGVSDVSLERRTGCEITRPELMGAIRVREEVVLLHGPSDLFAFLGIDIHSRGRIERVHTTIRVHMAYQLVQVVEPRESILVLEIRAHCHHDVTAAGLICLNHCNSYEVVHPRLHVVILQSRVVLDCLVRASHIPVKASWWAIISSILACEACEDLRICTEGWRSPPDELCLLLLPSQFEVLVINAAEEEPLEAHFSGEECSLRRRVPKRIQLPASPRSSAQLFHEELVPQGCLVNHVQEVGRCFIMHTPATVAELQLPGADKAPHQLPGRVILLPPPSGEESRLDVGELPVRVLLQTANHRVQDQAHISALNGVVLAREVFINGFQPAHIIVCVGDNVHLYSRFSLHSQCTAEHQSPLHPGNTVYSHSALKHLYA
mmetsp:Transcript_56397/g.134645  ORF Transcript_56397/g.134645 Transcript_56397/m.134645 type:complete len:411 (+) Transcript_56397:1963-3195(+)